MAFIASEAIDWITSTIGSSPGDAAISTLNQAGEMLVQLHSWRWLERTGTVDVVQDVDYALLPSDFRASLVMDEANSFYGFSVTSLEQLTRLKSGGYATDYGYSGTVTYRVLSNIPTPVMKLEPTPTESESGTFNIAYLAGWTELTSDNSNIEIVPWIKNLYRELVVAYARGYDEEDEVRAAPAGQLIEEHLAVIRRGITYRMAVNRDALINPSYGRRTQGWIQTGNAIRGGGAGRSYLRNAPGLPV